MNKKNHEVVIICKHCCNKCISSSNIYFDQSNCYINNMPIELIKKYFNQRIFCNNCKKKLGEIKDDELDTICLFRENLIFNFRNNNHELQQDHLKLQMYTQKKVIITQNILNKKQESQIRGYAKFINRLVRIQKQIDQKINKIENHLNKNNLR